VKLKVKESKSTSNKREEAKAIICINHYITKEKGGSDYSAGASSGRFEGCKGKVVRWGEVSVRLRGEVA